MWAMNSAPSNRRSRKAPYFCPSESVLTCYPPVRRRERNSVANVRNGRRPIVGECGRWPRPKHGSCLLPLEHQQLTELLALPVCAFIGDGHDLPVRRELADGDPDDLAVALFFRPYRKLVDPHGIQRVVVARPVHRIIPTVEVGLEAYVHRFAERADADPVDNDTSARRQLVRPCLLPPARSRR